MSKGKYQLLPPLATEDFERLRNDIAEHGIIIPIEVDEKGTILDGHHRVAIAKELGIDCPTITRSGLSESAKRLHAVSLNLARRQLTDFQKVKLGELIRPYLAEAARERMLLGKADPTAKTPQGTTRDEIARAVGISSGRTYERGLSVIRLAEKLSPDLLVRGDAGELTIRELGRELRARQKIAKRDEQIADIESLPAALPDGPFTTILVDPPWEYASNRDGASRRGQTNYATMNVEELCDVPVTELSGEDAVLWLWTTNSHLISGEALEVVLAWGFRPRTLLTWVKTDATRESVRLGVGDVLRGSTEHVLLCERGKPIYKRFTTASTALLAPSPKGHSRKPPELYDLIESLCPARHGGRLELFARVDKEHPVREGWQVWGHEARGEEAS